MVNVIDDDFGTWFQMCNFGMILSLVFMLILISPLPHAVRKLLTAPATLRVKLGDAVTIQIAHVIVVTSVGIFMMIQEAVTAYGKTADGETNTLKNIRLSKKWQYETYLWQITIIIA